MPVKIPTKGGGPGDVSLVFLANVENFESCQNAINVTIVEYDMLKFNDSTCKCPFVIVLTDNEGQIE